MVSSQELSEVRTKTRATAFPVAIQPALEGLATATRPEKRKGIKIRREEAKLLGRKTGMSQWWENKVSKAQ